MKVHENGPRRMWYDGHIRMWTFQEVDAAGNQVGDVDYHSDREIAFRWLATGSVRLPRVVDADELFARLSESRGHSIHGGPAAPDGFLEVWPADEAGVWIISTDEYSRLNQMLDEANAEREIPTLKKRCKI